MRRSRAGDNRGGFAWTARLLAASMVGALALGFAALAPWRAGASGKSIRTHTAAATPGAAVLVGAGPPGRTIPAGFLGLSIEYWALENYAGTDPHAVNPVLVRLIRQLFAGHPGLLRIGGVTTDRSWWPVPGLPRPPGAIYTLTRNRLQVARALAATTRARLLLGVQFEADSTAEASAESRAMMRIVGRKRIAGLELGNEPELYGLSPWYSQDGRSFVGRPARWNIDSYLPDFARIARSLGPAPVAGPTSGGWGRYLTQFLGYERGLSLVTLHAYPLEGCAAPRSSTVYPTLEHLLAPDSASGLAQALAPAAALAHAHGLPLRISEMNTVSCGDGGGVADTFASALWALDAVFSMAGAGVDGVNIHTYPGTSDTLFTFTRARSGWRAAVAPEYYGLLMFANATPTGSRLLDASAAGAPPTLRTWATTGRDARVRVVLIDEAGAGTQSVTVRIPGAAGPAALERLEAPSLTTTRGIRIGGRTFGARTTAAHFGRPRTARVAQSAGAYTLRLPPHSATLLTVRRTGR